MLKTLVAFILISSAATSQSLYSRIERVLTDFNAHIAKVLEQQEFDRHAKFVGVRERKARGVIKRGESRVKKLTRRMSGWDRDCRKLRDRLSYLRNKTRGVRNSTMLRRYGSLIGDVKRKIAQRLDWIQRAKKDIAKVEAEQAEAQKILVESAKIRDRMSRQAVTRR